MSVTLCDFLGSTTRSVQILVAEAFLDDQAARPEQAWNGTEPALQLLLIARVMENSQGGNGTLVAEPTRYDTRPTVLAPEQLHL